MTRIGIINQRTDRRKRLWARFDGSSQGGKSSGSWGWRGDLAVVEEGDSVVRASRSKDT